MAYALEIIALTVVFVVVVGGLGFAFIEWFLDWY